MTIRDTPEYIKLSKYLSPSTIDWLLLATADLETGGTFRSDLTSPTGAKGLFQFIRSSREKFEKVYGLPPYLGGSLITQARYALAHFLEGVRWITAKGLPSWLLQYNQIHPASNNRNMLRGIRYHYTNGPLDKPKPQNAAETEKVMTLWDKKMFRGTTLYPASPIEPDEAVSAMRGRGVDMMTTPSLPQDRDTVLKATQGRGAMGDESTLVPSQILPLSKNPHYLTVIGDLGIS
jgi:hypothetical protein